jgi:hypothetical protein
MVRLSDAISGDSAQDVDSLLQIIRDTKEDLVDIRKGLGKIANVGTEIAAGSFNQGVDELRHLVWELPLSKVVRPTLELCPPSLTHLFGDDARIKEALEAAPSVPSRSTIHALIRARCGRLRSQSPLRDPEASPHTPAMQEKAPALPPRRGRARRVSEKGLDFNWLPFLNGFS